MAKIFQAGPQGEYIKSDCQVLYTPGPTPLEIQIKSKVDALFSSAIEQLATSALNTLGILTGKLQIIDFGALPYVMMAQIETVIKRAHPDIKAKALPDFKDHAKYETLSSRFRRTRLYLPGNQPKLFTNAGIHKPDSIILDLEDSVPPGEKDAARLMVRNALRTIDFFGAERMVRINQGSQGFDDLDAIIPQNVQTILIPKTETAEQVIAVEDRVNFILKQEGLKYKVYYLPILESARGILNAPQIAMASKNNTGLAIGLEDYTADIGVPRTLGGKESLFARSMVVNAARAAQIQPLDSVFSDISNEAGLRNMVKEAKALGFEGLGCIHPRQIQPIHEEFTPSSEDLEKAMRIVIAAEDAAARGLGVVAVGSKMVDAPVVLRAEHTIQMAINAGALANDWKKEALQ
ncbi:MAG: citrate lyase ACP [Candidatus Marinimicrobia bacterium]|nr:citrate lyase ACP [Candidatus Neomarinimicrobiota bacterium]